MAIDSENKRRSIAEHEWLILPPLADGSISSLADRQHMIGLYRGTEISTPYPATFIHYTITEKLS